MNTLELDPGALTLADLEASYRAPCTIRLAPHAQAGIDAAAATVARAVASEQPVYGVNTGFGKLAAVKVEAADTAKLQRNLILSHCCGVGTPAAADIVRMMMLLKLNSLARGASGVRWAVLELLAGMLTHEVLPVVPSQGSVGASGDLSLIHI